MGIRVSVGHQCRGAWLGRTLRLFAGFCAAALVLCAVSVSAFAQQATVDVEDNDTFGRVVLDFPGLNLLPEHKIRSDNGVLVIEFETAVALDISRVPITLSKYVTIARADPDDRGARFALARGVKVNTMEAGAKLFLDFLPSTWTGPPPRLPEEVIAELARRAEEAARQAREAEMLRRVGDTKVRLDLRVGETPTFTRFVFAWNVPFEATLRRNEGTLSIWFNREASVDLSMINVDPPPFVESIMFDDSVEDGLGFKMTVLPDADVRAFRDDGVYVVDVQGKPGTATEDAVRRLLEAGNAHGKAGEDGSHDVIKFKGGVGGSTADHGSATGHGDPEASAHSTPAAPAQNAGGAHAADPHAAPAEAVPEAGVAHAADPHAAPAEPAPEAGAAHAAEAHAAPAEPAPEAGAAHAADPHAAPAQPAPEAGAAHAADPHAAPAEPAPEAGAAHAADPHAAPAEAAPEAGTAHAADTHVDPHQTQSAEPPHDDHATDAAAADGGNAAHAGHDAPVDAGPEFAERRSFDKADPVLRIEATRIGRATRLVFPYKRPIGSAMFSRGGALWLVFDDPAPLGVETLQTALAGIASSIEPRTIGSAQGLRITLVEPLLATLNPEGTYWVVTIGDMATTPTRPLQIKRQIRDNGAVSLSIPFGPVNSIHQVVDPTVGDTIVVVTALDPPRGLTKPQAFVEVDALSSGHGLALVPKSDDVTVVARDNAVIIDRPDGLSVSTAVPVDRATLLDLPGAMGVKGSDRQAYLDLANLQVEEPSAFWTKRHELSSEVSEAQTKDEKLAGWYRFAEFYLANGLAFETGGVLDYISAFAPEEATSSRMAMMRAAAAAMTHRYREVLPFLDRPEFAEHPEAAIWKTIAYNNLGDYPAARRSFPRAEVAVGRFPVAVQNRFLLAAVQSAIELNDFGRARSLLAQINPRTLTPNERATIDILNARAADATGHAGDAMELLSKAVQNGRGPVEAEATFRLVNLQRREGLITPDQAADRLEQLAISWRGDEIELKTLRTLGQLSVERGDYRRAFELLRVANMVDSQSDTTRLMQEEMQSAFASLFLDGKSSAMEPIDALALYYDFRELTPVGRRGDEMVRNLASTLVDVDLLQQAAELLSYQVENRLRGAAKAKVAADLALVYLLDQRPDRAMMALSRTRQAELPVDVERQRRIVEARALSDTGKPDLALELLEPLAGADVERLRAEVLWAADRHQKAGEQFERLLGARWAEDLPLNEREQHDVLRAGVAYALAQDDVSLDRLRSKFQPKMAKTKSSGAFDVVSGPIDSAGAEFNQVAQQIVASDSMSAFLSEYRKRYLSWNGDDAPILVEQDVPADWKTIEREGVDPAAGEEETPPPAIPSASIAPSTMTADMAPAG